MADLTTQLAVEQADMIRGKRLRPLATVSDKSLDEVILSYLAEDLDEKKK